MDLRAGRSWKETVLEALKDSRLRQNFTFLQDDLKHPAERSRQSPDWVPSETLWSGLKLPMFGLSLRCLANKNKPKY